MALSARQSVEFFHLVFLRALVARGEDKSLYALKGGCNLRFFFGSIRYSEDMDLDVRVTSKETLKNKVDRLFESPLLLAPLKAQGLVIVDVSAPKQTATTQRWKVGLQRGSTTPIRTKVEFSRRDTVDGVRFESVRAEVSQAYGLTPLLATHYTTEAAVLQKIQALAGRPEPQTRDVFDLQLLLARPEAKGLSAPASLTRSAIENAISLSYDDFVAQVVAYLEPEQAPLYEGREHWDAMQEYVVAQLEALSR